MMKHVPGVSSSRENLMARVALRSGLLKFDSSQPLPFLAKVEIRDV
jgi:hypothetical protein